MDGLPAVAVGRGGYGAGVADEEYVELVLSVVESIPAGRVMTYGAIAEVVRERYGKGSARTVGGVMARYGGGVPWHRVVAASGRLIPGHEIEHRARLVAEGVPLRDGDRIDLAAALWWPDDPH